MDHPSSANTPFSPPRHWVGVEELDADYWRDPAVLEKRAQEFHDKPVETVDLIDRLDKAGFARRDFLTLMGASMAMTTLACARRPVHKIIPYVIKPEEITPGVAVYYASTLSAGGVDHGVLIKTREGRPIKIEGNPDHPMSRGKLSASAQAAVLDLYDPDRLKNPVSRARGAAISRPTSWQEADTAITGKLKQGAGRVRVLSGRVSGPATQRLTQEFLAGFRDGKWVEWDPHFDDAVAQGQLQSYGTSLIPAYHFDRADVVVSFSADFLGTWISPVQFAQDWSQKRKLHSAQAAHAKMSKLFVFESMMSVTGANADERIGIRSGDELKLVLAIANELAITQKTIVADAQVQAVLATYTPAKVATETGIPLKFIKQTASALQGARGRSLVVAGGPVAASADAVALQIAVNYLNSALGNEGVTVDVKEHFQRGNEGYTGLSRLIAEMNRGEVDALILYRSNPLYTLPRTAGFEDALKKVPLVIAIADRDDETARGADYVLPDHDPLENWGDSEQFAGLVSIQQPVIAPLHSTRAFQDSLIQWSRGGLKTSGLLSTIAAASADKATWHDYLQTHWQGSVSTSWNDALRTGVARVSPKGGGSRNFKSAALAAVKKYAPDGEGLKLSLYHKISLGDGTHANNPWLQEMPDPVTTITWDNYLNISPALARKLSLSEGEVVEVSGPGAAKAELPVHIQPGLHPAAVAAALGYGRRAAGKVGTECGVDVAAFIAPAAEGLRYSGIPVTLRRTFKTYRLAAVQWHNVSENRPVLNDITLAEFRHNPATANHTDPHLKMEKVPTLWPVHEYKGYRWGMAIDLTSCTGCSACVIACQAENNIPVVGRDNVRVSRQMHWIRIDRYYSGSSDNPQVVFQPMLCQHCENAPCETVCPVLATVHDDEGLNVQAYNRCVGTRYCQNNCPYKVRRFNFFDHWKTYDSTLNLAWNPDVTVRTRGIMEKCTFCIQRINGVKDHAKQEARKVRDGELLTACQQTCPTDAIVFGDINDPASRVSKLRAESHAFRVLEVLNTKPSISYGTKVRNVEAPAHQPHHSG